MRPSATLKTRTVHITGTMSVSAPTVQRITNVKAEWIITPDGAIRVKMNVEEGYGN